MNSELLTQLKSLDYNLVHSAVAITNTNEFTYTAVYIAAELLVLLFPMVLYYLWRRPELRAKHHGGRKAVLLAVMAIVLVFALKSLIALLYFKLRPFAAHTDLFYMPLQVDSSSFPSGHAMVAFAVAASLTLSGHHKLGGVLYVVAVIVACGRVFAGVHYPSDVIAGALLGMFSAWYLHREASTLKRYLPNH